MKTDHETFTAHQHDSIWLPAGTRLTYESDNALLFYAIYPADWAPEE